MKKVMVSCLFLVTLLFASNSMAAASPFFKCKVQAFEKCDSDACMGKEIATCISKKAPKLIPKKALKKCKGRVRCFTACYEKVATEGKEAFTKCIAAAR